MQIFFCRYSRYILKYRLLINITYLLFFVSTQQSLNYELFGNNSLTYYSLCTFTFLGCDFGVNRNNMTKDYCELVVQTMQNSVQAVLILKKLQDPGKLHQRQQLLSSHGGNSGSVKMWKSYVERPPAESALIGKDITPDNTSNNGLVV